MEELRNCPNCGYSLSRDAVERKRQNNRLNGRHILGVGIAFAVAGFLGVMAFGGGWWMMAFVVFVCLMVGGALGVSSLS